ncbi:MAG: adaptor protein MecA [Peptococcaceae bacterium]|nr:adaptor protein MecA [Peptococcaceae bacterium]
MRILKVDDNTVRIFISFTELADRNISLADFFQRSARTEQFFWELISKARDEVDFNLDQPFWIQATLASEDEFVITVIKQDEQVDTEINHIFEANLKEKKKPQSTSKAHYEQEWVYVFSEFEDLLTAISLLPGLPNTKSALYEYEDEYYLALNKFSTPRKQKISEAILDEFGELMMITEDFLKEHAEPIIKEQAVKILKELASGKIKGAN